MSTKTYPSFSQAFLLLLYMFVASLAGLPGYLPYLIWKNDFTHALGDISLYLAAVIIPTVYAAKRIKKSAHSFSLKLLFRKKINTSQVIYLAFLTVSIGICIDYIIRLLHLPNFFTAEIDRTLKLPWLGFVALVILPAFFEELLLRGIILEQFLKRYSAGSAVLLSAFLFGLMHGNPSQIFAGFVAGCFLGWVYFKTKNIKYCILIHFVNNGVSWIEFQLTDRLPANSFVKAIKGLDANLPIFIMALLVSVIGIYLLNKICVNKTAWSGR